MGFFGWKKNYCSFADSEKIRTFAEDIANENDT
jgi:hypothetical protein